MEPIISWRFLKMYHSRIQFNMNLCSREKRNAIVRVLTFQESLMGIGLVAMLVIYMYDYKLYNSVKSTIKFYNFCKLLAYLPSHLLLSYVKIKSQKRFHVHGILLLSFEVKYSVPSNGYQKAENSAKIVGVNIILHL